MSIVEIKVFFIVNFRKVAFRCLFFYNFQISINLHKINILRLRRKAQRNAALDGLAISGVSHKTGAGVNHRDLKKRTQKML